jgi:hypothetical protein
MTRPEVELAFRGSRIGNQDRRIAGPPLSDIERHLVAGHFCDGTEHLLDRIAKAGAKIVDAASMAIGQHLQSKDVGCG